MEQYLNALEEMLAASCAQIGGEYFQLPIAEADAVYRERVYCYELLSPVSSNLERFSI